MTTVAHHDSPSQLDSFPKTSPRILFVLRYHYLRFTGGAETQCWLHATEFARRGWDVHFVSEMNSVPAPNPLEGVTLHGLPEDPSYWSGNRDELRRVIAALRPDAIYTQVANQYSGHAVQYAPAGAVTIWAAAADTDARFWYFIRNFWKSSRPLSFLRRLPVYLYIRRIASRGMRRADIVLAQHERQATWFRRMGLNPVIVRNSHAAVPEERVQSHEGVPTVLWVGSVKSWKRPELFFELARHCLDLPARFVVVGQCFEDRYRQEMAALEREQPNFKYAGRVPFEQVGEFFAQAHLFVSTSVAEGFPNTFVQAWMHGVPVVSLDVNPEDLLTSQQIGRHVTTTADLERAVRDLVLNPDLRRETGRRAYEFASQEFNLQRNIDKIESLLAEKGVRLPARP